MIPFISFILLIGTFVAGHVLGVNTTAGVIMVGVFALAQGVIIAAAQTRGFEGQRVLNIPTPLTWEKVFLNVVRMAIDRGRVAGTEPVYVQTPKGPVPVTGIFTARINHVLAIVMDTEEASAVDATHEFNSLKQGVM